MSVAVLESRRLASQRTNVEAPATRPRAALVVAALGFFVVTLDAFVANVALPSIGADPGGGITGLQCVVDGYTLMFAALLLSAGAVSDRIGARTAFGIGLVAFTAASAACGLAPQFGVLIAARVAQGAGAAVMLPASLALIREAYSNGRERARAIAFWSFGAAVASSAGPAVGGLLTLVTYPYSFCGAELLVTSRRMSGSIRSRLARANPVAALLLFMRAASRRMRSTRPRRARTNDAKARFASVASNGLVSPSEFRVRVGREALRDLEFTSRRRQSVLARLPIACSPASPSLAARLEPCNSQASCGHEPTVNAVA